MLNFILDGILMWEEGGTQWTNGPMAGHIIVRMGRPSMGGRGASVLDCEYILTVSPLVTIFVLTFAHCFFFQVHYHTSVMWCWYL